jgi:hypothetical protein
MQIDTEHLHYWMQAIRQSPDPMRTMDAFWEGQLKSKEWLIDKFFNTQHEWQPALLGKQSPFRKNKINIHIHGGWVGVLASMLFQYGGDRIGKITSIDIDPSCQPIASMMNKKEEMEGRFEAVTADMVDYECNWDDVDVIINTSAEHLTEQQYIDWRMSHPLHVILVVQSNNYKIPEHVSPMESLEEFKNFSRMRCWWKGELELPLYNRYMIIGKP